MDEADDVLFDAMLHATVTTTMVADLVTPSRTSGPAAAVPSNTAPVAGTRGSEYNPAYGAGKARA
ncbi:MAG: hypothetical protein U0W40_11375 [Acidimicrobiia bacterium]